MMKKNHLFIYITLFTQFILAQEVFLKVGNNTTTYKYKNSAGQGLSGLENGNGVSLELGYKEQFIRRRHNYDSNFGYYVAIALNEYNAKANASGSHEWETKYLGLQYATYYSFLTDTKFNVELQLGLQLATLLSGKQRTNDTYFNLKDSDEFNKPLFMALPGVEFEYKMGSIGEFILGYEYGFTLRKAKENKETLNFNNHNIYFGFNLLINNFFRR